MNRFLPELPAKHLFRTIQMLNLKSEYDAEKHRLTLFDEARQEALYFRLPITVAAPNSGTETINYVIMLIQAGNCAMGYFEQGHNRDHKVWRSYMVRKKQGKSQVKYLKTKGKSRAGSRVRLGETMEFFENINGRLQEYFDDHEVHRIAISCSKTLLPYLYTSKVATPFTKTDPRLFKIPKHIHTPVYEVLLDANRFLLRGELIFEPEQQAFADELLAKAGITESDTEPADDFTEDNDELLYADDDYFEDEEDEDIEW